MKKHIELMNPTETAVDTSPETMVAKGLKELMFSHPNLALIKTTKENTSEILERMNN